ncbi:UDP-4-amino-4,6-dideoxy-N-acetyl-beta-L-altrosamine N-acetyltransferase [Halobacillus sp. ACCC02827]|uniref:UDP-4-amino-4, 6-dideoxy-N-acetyl-beta-L-altrosamine N-acetyltransferase n=1 Tax=Halobacillus sp. ACCC02827 TaxID=3052090 RepID=UPI00256FECA1|nr:UDP-4-amino-4,6-dideoxy-N-acetyl-beta-L-altrosamine N-acetyltransferase [Halobacillus sp. ACCC02827]WJE16334.1 UDP-4-amino-4,6-dideoxy-N-acetyl-beta-L-altrosamine N-acetyltransferase [Halobacillus sp. ACCC02827]
MTEYTLRDVKEKDWRQIWTWRNREEIRRHMYNNQPIEWDSHLEWMKKEQKNTQAHAKIFVSGKRPLGFVRFSDIDRVHKRCLWGFYIGDPAAPKGAGTEMGKLALDYIFKQEPVHKVCAEVLSSNTGSVRYHEKLGFVQEGRLCSHWNRGGVFLDVILLALFKEDWEGKEWR